MEDRYYGLDPDCRRIMIFRIFVEPVQYDIMFHYRGDGTFIAAGDKFNYRKKMVSKLALEV